jgi:subtilisin family serine protease
MCGRALDRASDTPLQRTPKNGPVFHDFRPYGCGGYLAQQLGMSNRLRVFRLATAAVAILLLATPVLAGPARDKKADKALRGALKGKTEQHSVILRVKPGTSRQIRLAIEKCGGVVKKEHQLIDALTVNVRGNCLDALLENQNVKSAGSDASVTSTPVLGFSDDSVNADPVQVYGAYSVREAVGGHEWATGSGVGVAVIDSGIAPLPAFEDRITAFYDFTGGGIRR